MGEPIELRTVLTTVGKFVSVDDLHTFIDQFADNIRVSGMFNPLLEKTSVETLRQLKIALRIIDKDTR